MPPSPPPAPPSKIARDQRAANRSAGLVPVSSKPKSTSRKRQQSNADESVSKRNKTATNDTNEAANDTATAAEEAIDIQKGGKKGKKAKKTGGKGKNSYLSFFFGLFSILMHPPLLVGRHGLTVNVRIKLRMLKALLTSKRMYSCILCF